MQVGDLVKTKAFGGIGIVLQVDNQGHLVQIKWLDGGYGDPDEPDDPRSYWFHPSNLEAL